MRFPKSDTTYLVHRTSIYSYPSISTAFWSWLGYLGRYVRPHSISPPIFAQKHRRRKIICGGRHYRVSKAVEFSSSCKDPNYLEWTRLSGPLCRTCVSVPTYLRTSLPTYLTYLRYCTVQYLCKNKRPMWNSWVCSCACGSSVMGCRGFTTYAR